jgi:hypothetical protein
VERVWGGATLIDSDPLSSVPFISSRTRSYWITSNSILLDFQLGSYPLALSFFLPSPTPHRGPQTRDPAAERLGDQSYRFSSSQFHFISFYLNSALLISRQFNSNRLKSVWLRSSLHIRSIHPVPQAPQWPAESWEAESDQINLDQIISRFL